MVRGIIEYIIEDGGRSLIGRYTNNKGDGDFYGEIARRNDPVNANGMDLIGVYQCAYYDPDTLYNGELTISSLEGKTNVYSFRWNINPRISFEGIGFRIDRNKLIVYYDDERR